MQKPMWLKVAAIAGVGASALALKLLLAKREYDNQMVLLAVAGNFQTILREMPEDKQAFWYERLADNFDDVPTLRDQFEKFLEMIPIEPAREVAQIKAEVERRRAMRRKEQTDSES
ncbi:MAG: hypothetical protein ACQR33_03055 [Candidatus Saccharibacteria bacterium]